MTHSTNQVVQAFIFQKNRSKLIGLIYILPNSNLEFRIYLFFRHSDSMHKQKTQPCILESINSSFSRNGKELNAIFKKIYNRDKHDLNTKFCPEQVSNVSINEGLTFKVSSSLRNINTNVCMSSKIKNLGGQQNKKAFKKDIQFAEQLVLEKIKKKSKLMLIESIQRLSTKEIGPRSSTIYYQNRIDPIDSVNYEYQHDIYHRDIVKSIETGVKSKKRSSNIIMNENQQKIKKIQFKTASPSQHEACNRIRHNNYRFLTKKIITQEKTSSHQNIARWTQQQDESLEGNFFTSIFAANS